MGQGWTSLRTMMAYSVATNRREAVASAKLRLGSTEALKWYRLDDGVMGGRSSTQHTTEGGALTFAGEVTASDGRLTPSTRLSTTQACSTRAAAASRPSERTSPAG